MSVLLTSPRHQLLSSWCRLLEEAPYLARCSDNKTAMLIRPREYAVKWPYMQVNRKDMLSWLVFDIDHDHLAIPNPYIWQDEGLPPPNLIVRDRTSNKAHLFYAIIPVCTSDKARSRPIEYAKSIYRAMALRLHSDLSYSGPVAKTPFHPWWSTTELHRSVYELGELADSLQLNGVERRSLEEREIEVSYSRNCTLFELTRRYAYEIVDEQREAGSYAEFKRCIDVFAHLRNQGGSDQTPLPVSEVNALVKSVSRWTWDHYVAGSSRHRNVMKLDPTLSLQERQRRAAKRTHRVRCEKTRRRIMFSCQVMLRKGKTLSVKQVAHSAWLCRQTINKYACIIELVQKAFIGKKPDLLESDVNYARHQISAPRALISGCVKEENRTTLVRDSVP